MRNKYLWAGTIIGIILVFDQVTKYVIEKQVVLHEVKPVIPGFFNITHVRNKGAAFSLFANAPEVFRNFFFSAVTIVAVVVIVFLIRKAHERLLLVAFSLVAGGAIGNLIDRIRYGEVVDFIQWYVKSFYWPSFNIADSAITVGVCLLVYDMLVYKSRNENSGRTPDR